MLWNNYDQKTNQDLIINNALFTKTVVAQAGVGLAIHLQWEIDFLCLSMLLITDNLLGVASKESMYLESTF